MQALERSAGARLLIRTKDGVAPTEAGKVAYRHAKLLARQLDRARVEVRSLATVPVGRVTVGMAPHSHARRLIQPLLKIAAEQYPEILLHISENFEGLLADDLRLGRMDMALLYETVARPGFRSEHVSTEALEVVGHSSLLGAPSPDPTGALPMLLPSAAHAIRHLVEAIYSSHRIRPRIVAEIESYETLAAAVAEGLGVTVLPHSMAIEFARAHGLTSRPFGAKPTFITLVLSTVQDHAPSEAARVIHVLLARLAAEAGAELVS